MTSNNKHMYDLDNKNAKREITFTKVNANNFQ